MAESLRYAVGVPNVGQFGEPRLLVDLAVAAEEAGWDAFFVWDHLLYADPRWHVADPTVVISAVAARTTKIRIGVLVTVLARRRVAKVARETVTIDHLSAGRLHLRRRARLSACRVHRVRRARRRQGARGADG